MRILITGGAGLIGSHLCDYFIARGDEVIAVDNFITGSPDNIAQHKDNPRFKFIRQDVTDFLRVEAGRNDPLSCANIGRRRPPAIDRIRTMHSREDVGL